ncbi:helix-turn-helix domain-containing protein [Shewanella sp. D64]|uniref:GlxA family transcriptional regulator n=1 Tax=unclassified Shewanella TaxID=196818 RepID=UPI0022BA1AAA|nr:MULTISPECIES: helix-turn-helix domain-containing protein [unclassified Shewanella]MEC4726324.1 helix-turn-helix domain-containing protein [Shewanella sp. D64]MEC4738336.1 helix-turn-helix domain-containing protein [Shewanella sp. E94]WBJ95470.1 helix-turn-helix domain-containing protein [Shewanella sp. MTB7]
MKTIYILAAGNVVAGGIVSFLDVFSFCNIYWRRINPEASEDLFHCHVISADGQPVNTNQGIQIPAIGLDKAEDILKADAVILASALVTNREEFQYYLEDFTPLFKPLTLFATSEKPLAAYCSGTMMLAASGLLDGRQATTVWWLSEMFERNFPKVKLSLDRLVVSDGHLHTAGATTSNLSLALHIINLLAGEQIANQIAKILLIDPNRSSQQPFMTMALAVDGHNHRDELVTKIQNWMQQHLQQSFLLDDIADKFAVGKRTLIRRFKQAVNETPASYMQRLRVDEAKRLLETTELALEQIVERVGYEDVSSFRKLFIQLTSLSPREYRLKFNTHACC